MAEDGAGGSNQGISSSSGEASRLQLLQEMRQQNFDSIRFASYRTACKLRFIQKKVHFHNVDIWNVIEAFRENGLNTLEPTSTLGVSRLETLLSSLFHALNKRVPVAQQAKVDATTALLMNWLLAAYTSGENNKISVFSVKVALATLCAGKNMDKFRYIYSQISDSNGHMIHWRFADYLKEVLALTAAVYETPSFGYSEGLANSIFPPNSKVTVNDFLDTLMSDPAPHCLIWLPLYHRMAAVEGVVHPIPCDACHKENFTGFRYRCQKCHSYQLCQDCFWRGRVSGPHNNDHETREYSSFKSPSKQIGHSLRKSFRCVPEKGKNNLPRFPEQPEKTLDLSHIVPPSPLPSHNGFPESGFMAPFDSGSMDSRSTLRSMDSSRLEDEHKLIARYAMRLAQEARAVVVPRSASKMSQADQAGRAPSDANLTSSDISRAQRELISHLEAKNKEIMREIARLRRQQEINAAGLENPALMSELRSLRQRKDELETHLVTLQDSRRQLMVQLEGLMKLLKNHQASPRSTPNSSPRSTKSPPLPPGGVPSSRSAPPTPGGPLTSVPQQQQQNQQPMSQSYQSSAPPTSSANMTNNAMLGSMQNPIPDSLSCVGGDVRSAFGTNSLPGSGSSSANNSLGRSLRNDLLVAADSVTNAMSTLVRELNSDSDQEDHTPAPARHNIRKPLGPFLLFPTLDIAEYEKQVTASSVETAMQARALFLYTHSWLKRAKAFYTLQDHPMDYISVILDLSELYRHITFHEEDIESQYAIQKLWADALETLSTVLREIRPQCYIAISVELLRELAEIHLEMMGLNLKRIYVAQEAAPEASDTTVHKMEALASIHSRLEQFGDNLGCNIDPVESELMPVCDIAGNVCQFIDT